MLDEVLISNADLFLSFCFFEEKKAERKNSQKSVGGTGRYFLDEYEKSFTMLTAAPRSHTRALYDPNKLSEVKYVSWRWKARLGGSLDGERQAISAVG